MDARVFINVVHVITLCVNSPVVQTQLLTQAKDGERLITTISSSDKFTTEEPFPQMSIQIPSELIEMFVHEDDVVRAVSYLYYNVENLFPSGLPGENE